jgi:hypothetical protein
VTRRRVPDHNSRVDLSRNNAPAEGAYLHFPEREFVSACSGFAAHINKNLLPGVAEVETPMLSSLIELDSQKNCCEVGMNT